MVKYGIPLRRKLKPWKMTLGSTYKEGTQNLSLTFWNMYMSPNFIQSPGSTLPILCNLETYLSAVERATSLFFFYDRTNCCRWTPLFLQDCYQLKDKFPLLYESYMNSGFVMNCNRKGSAVPFDQALEQCYNHLAKVSGGIIGVTRKKDALAFGTSPNIRKTSMFIF